MFWYSVCVCFNRGTCKCQTNWFSCSNTWREALLTQMCWTVFSLSAVVCLVKKTPEVSVKLILMMEAPRWRVWRCVWGVSVNLWTQQLFVLQREEFITCKLQVSLLSIRNDSHRLHQIHRRTVFEDLLLLSSLGSPEALKMSQKHSSTDTSPDIQAVFHFLKEGFT